MPTSTIIIFARPQITLSDLLLLRDLYYLPYLDTKWTSPHLGSILRCDKWPHTELISDCLSSTFLFGKQTECDPGVYNSGCPLSAVNTSGDDHNTSYFESGSEDAPPHLTIQRPHTVRVTNYKYCMPCSPRGYAVTLYGCVVCVNDSVI